jgi:hypothetical protein
MQGGGFGDEFEDRLRPELNLRWGTVQRNVDPHKLGRVTLYIPGITSKESGWALPVGMPGSGKSTQGSYRVPPVGAVVLVGFILGDIDFPFYIAGPFQQLALENGSTRGGPPRIVQEQTPEDAPKVHVLAETESFEIYIIDKEDEKKFVVASLARDGNEAQNLIEMDLNDGSIRMKAADYLIMEAPMLSMSGVKMQLGGRIVLPVGAPI